MVIFNWPPTIWFCLEFFVRLLLAVEGLSGPMLALAILLLCPTSSTSIEKDLSLAIATLNAVVAVDISLLLGPKGQTLSLHLWLRDGSKGGLLLLI